jgi:SOS-response transcriptional repressor LexA
VKWYAARAEMMFEDIQNAIKHNGIRYASTSTHHTNKNAVTPRPPASPTKTPVINHWLRFKQLDVYESVRAHPKGGIATKNSDSFIEVNTVWIENREYKIHRAIASRVIEINPDPKVAYSFIRVEGDSMIEATPTSIEEGDYVLVQINRDPDDEELVVATYHDPQTGDVTGAVKLKRSDGLHSKNSAKNYPIMPLKNVKYVGEVIAIAKPF